MGNQKRTDTTLITGGQSEKDRHYIDNRGTIREGQKLH